MSAQIKYTICGLITVGTFVGIWLLKPIPQDPAFHLFADNKTWLGVPHFYNVFSNLPFLVVAVIGIFKLTKTTFSLTSVSLVTGIFLTGLGSAWYHLHPDNDTLVWDRIPMTIIFSSLLSLVVQERISYKLGKQLLIPLLILGIFSVLYWHYTESKGVGDLRLYGWVQFFPMMMISLILILFQQKKQQGKKIIFIVLFYAAAKLCEYMDNGLLELTSVISGHSMKHLFAAGATWYIIQLLPGEKTEYPHPLL